MFDYFYGQSGEMFSYFRVPKILFRDIRFKDLSTDAKTLYGILLDRMSLSVKNGWLDGQGRVYIIFPICQKVRHRLCHPQGHLRGAAPVFDVFQSTGCGRFQCRIQGILGLPAE